MLGPMTMADLMQAPVLCAAPGTPLSDIAAMMIEARTGSVVIVQDGTVEGIVTRSDLGVGTRSVPQSMGRVRSPALVDEFMGDQQQFLQAVERVRSIPASDVMSTPVITVAPDDPAWTAVEIFLSRKIGHLPVMDGDRLVGVVSRLDLLRLIAGGASA